MNETFRVKQNRDKIETTIKKNSGVDNVERAGWMSIEELYNSFTEAGSKYMAYLKERYPEAQPVGQIKNDIVEGVEDSLQALDIAQQDALDLQDYYRDITERTESLKAEYQSLQAKIKAQQEKAQQEKTEPKATE